MTEKKQCSYIRMIDEAKECHLLDGVECPFIPGRYEDGTPAVYDLMKEGEPLVLNAPYPYHGGGTLDEYIKYPNMYLRSPYFLKNNPYKEIQCPDSVLCKGREAGATYCHRDDHAIIVYPYFLIKYWRHERKPIYFPFLVDIKDEFYHQVADRFSSYRFRILTGGVASEIMEAFIPGSSIYNLDTETLLISSASGIRPVHLEKIGYEETSKILEDASY